MKTALLASVVMLSLTACGTWSRPNTTEAEFNADRYACEIQIAQTYPVQMVYSPGMTTPSRTTCQTYYGQTNCTTTPGVQYGGTQTDMNAFARIGGVDSCLRARGYVYTNKR